MINSCKNTKGRVLQRKSFFIILVLGMLAGMLYLYKSFLMNFLIASLICIATFNIKVVLDKFFRSNFFSTIFSVLFLLMFLILPIMFVLQQALDFFAGFKTEQLINYLETSKIGLINTLDSLSFLQPHLESFKEKFSTQNIINYTFLVSSYIGRESIHFIVDICFIVVFLFFLFFYGKKIYIRFLYLIPLKVHQTHEIFQEVSGVLKIVLFTSLVNVLLQGIAFGILVYCSGYNNAILLGVLYGIASLIPIVGGALVWVPVAGYELYFGHTTQVFIIVIYSLVFIGFFIDNIIKPFIIGFVNKRILKKPLKLNEMIIFFAILAGFSSFGFWGIVIGPALTSLFISLMRIFQKTKRFENV